LTGGHLRLRATGFTTPGRARLCVACAVVWSIAGLGVPLGQARGSQDLQPLGIAQSTTPTSAMQPADPLVIPGAQLLDGGEQRADAAFAHHESPEAWLAREESQAKFEGLNASQAAKLASEAFPEAIAKPAAPPEMPAGAKITGYPTDNSAQLSLPEGKRVLVESITPLAVETSPGHREAIDLGLSQAGNGYAPIRSLVPVTIGKHLPEGATLTDVGVSLTPVDAQGHALSGAEGQIDGASVFYGASGSDMDSAIKPGAFGVSVDDLLRSPRSPRNLYFRVSLPQGASLQQSRKGAGVAQVIDRGRPLATILVPSARDASGWPVPVTMRVHGDVLSLTVDERAGEYQYPIEVDPEMLAQDRQLWESVAGMKSNWVFSSHYGVFSGGGCACDSEWGILGVSATNATYKAGEEGTWEYQTHGDSDIYEFSGTTSLANYFVQEPERKAIENHVYAYLEMDGPEGQEEWVELMNDLSLYEGEPTTPICPKPPHENVGARCQPGSGHETNQVHFGIAASKECTGCSLIEDLTSGNVLIWEPPGSVTTEFNTSSKELKFSAEGKEQKRPNVLAGGWLTDSQGAFEAIANDKGIGVSKTWLEYEYEPGHWERIPGIEHNYFAERRCYGVQCVNKEGKGNQREIFWLEGKQEAGEVLSVGTLAKRLPNGDDHIRYRAEDMARESVSTDAAGEATLKVAKSPPHNLELNGLPGELSEGSNYTVEAKAADGEGPNVAAPGVKRLSLYIGKGAQKTEIPIKKNETSGQPEWSGPCEVPNGECPAWAKFQINGAQLGAGPAAIVVQAEDNAGNVATSQEFQLTVRHSTPVALGPGSLDLQSGDFSLGATDVSMGNGLTVSRTYSSRGLTLGQEGPLGPQWLISTGADATLSELYKGSMMLTAANGGQTIFELSEGKYLPPPGDSNLKLEKKEGAFYLEEPTSHSKVKFAQPEGSSTWLPTIQEGPLPTDEVTYTYRTKEVEVEGKKKKVIEPLEALAPKPQGAECPTNGEFKLGNKEAEEKERGCRALTFNYAEASTATGQSEGEWGDYKGNLTRVYFLAWNHKESRLERIEVAHYLYGSKGRLRAEWDPRYEKEPETCAKEAGTGKCLKTLYGYDEEGHITALTPPGQQPWIFTYGTAKGDSGTGRLLKLYRAPASAALWKGEGRPSLVPETTPPTISGTPVVGVRMGVSNGVWYGEPAAYAFQWERCNRSGEGCEAIEGATNQNYTPTTSDAGHRLKVQVSATNGGGSGVALSAASEVVLVREPITEYPLPGGSGPAYIAQGPDGNLWFTDKKTNKLGKITTSGAITEYALPTGSEPVGITLGPDGNLWFTESYSSKVAKMTTSGDITEYALPTEGYPEGITSGPDGNLWYTVTKGDVNRIGKISTQGEITEYALPSKSRAHAITTGPDGNLWFTNERASRIGKITTSGAITEYLVASNGDPTARSPLGITAGPDGNLWFTNPATETIGKITTSGTVNEYSLPTGSSPAAITAGPDGNLWFTENYSNKVAKITTSGQISEYSLPAGSEPEGIASGPDGDLWFAESGTSKIGKLGPYTYTGPTPTEAEYHTPQPGTTIEYGLPVAETPTIRELQPNAGPNAGGTEVTITGNNFSGATAVKFGSANATSFKVESSTLISAVSPPGAGTVDITVTTPEGESAATAADRFTYGGCPTQAGNVAAGASLSGGYLGLGGKGGTGAGLSGSFSCALINTSSSPYKLTQANISFGASLWQMPGFLPYEWTLKPLRAAEGTLEALKNSSGEVEGYSASLTMPVSLTLSFFSYTCTSSPLEVKLVSGKSGSAEGTMLKGSLAGGLQGTLKAKEFPVPKFTESSSCPSLLASLINLDGALPAPAGQAEMSFNLALAQEAPAPGAPLLGVGVPPPMSPRSVAAWGQEDDPIEGTSITPPDEPQGWPASSYKRATVYYLDERGRLTNVASPSDSPYGSISTTEYNEYNDVTRTLTPDNRVRSLEAGKGLGPLQAAYRSAEESKRLDTGSTYNGEHGEATAEPGTELIERKGPQHMVKLMHPSKEEQPEVLARERTTYRYDEEEKETCPGEVTHAPEGETHHLLTETQTFAEVAGQNTQIEVRTTKTSYAGQSGFGWTLRAPTSVTTDPRMCNHSNGLNLTQSTLYYGAQSEDYGQVQETRGAGAPPSGESAHDQRIVYYSSAANLEHGHGQCGEHREWAGLTCMTLPAKQPEDPKALHAPTLPETTTTAYNIYDQPEVVEEAFKRENGKGEVPTTTRVKHESYDKAGRIESSETSSNDPTEEKPLPQVTYAYSETTGAQVSESAEGHTTQSAFNTLGELIEYKDGQGNTAHYSYEEPDGLLTEVSDSAPSTSKEGRTFQRYSYDPTTKELVKLEDSAAGTFTASYDVEGKLESETYPNAMCANYAYNAVGEATRLEYLKTANCSEAGAKVWFSETTHPSVHGEVLSGESTVGATSSAPATSYSNGYFYDAAGRLEEVKETPAGKGCTTRTYEYEPDSEGNRIKQATRKPKSSGECAGAGEGEEVQKHEYDEANRLKDEGVEYDALGNTTRLSARDSGGPEGGKEIKSEFYVDNQVQSQTQNGTTLEDSYDPEGRLRKSTSLTGLSKKEVISHYDGAGAAVSWSCEATAEQCDEGKWTRKIPGIDGTLCGVQENGGEVVIQLHDLKGDIVATAAASASAENLLSTYNVLPFGLPGGETAPPKYAWLGAGGIASEPAFDSGAIVEGGTSYVPETGRTLQTQAISAPGLPEGSGPLVPYALQEEPWGITDSESAGEAAVGREAAQEAEARRKVEEHERELAAAYGRGYEAGYGAGYAGYAAAAAAGAGAASAPGGAGGEGGAVIASRRGPLKPREVGCSVWAHVDVSGTGLSAQGWGNFSCTWSPPALKLLLCFEQQSIRSGTWIAISCGSWAGEGQADGFHGESHSHTAWTLSPCGAAAVGNFTYRLALWAWLTWRSPSGGWPTAEEWVWSGTFRC
jgi:virginiamycin B lyase